MREERLAHLRKLYALLADLEKQIGGARTLASCSGRMPWPRRGVYFFMEHGEKRSDTGEGPRIVRVGTHALRPDSKTRLWTRLRQHRGDRRKGAGNHRGSIFRLIVGTAVIAKQRYDFPTWDTGNTASVEIRAGETVLEREVSEIIGAFPFLWLSIDDEPGAESLRAYIERKEDRIRKERGGIKERYRPEWEKLREAQKEERGNLRKVQHNASHRVKHFLRDKPSEYIRMEKKDRGRFLSEMFDVHTRYAVELAKRHKEQRTDLAKHIKREAAQSFKTINESYKANLAALRERQKREAHETARRHAAESQQIARDIKEGRDREAFRDQESAKLRREIGESAKDITKRRSLTDRFNQLNERMADREKTRPAAQAPSPAAKAREDAGARKPPSQDKAKDSAAERSRKLREAADYIGKSKERAEKEGPVGAFRDTGDEITRSRGKKDKEQGGRFFRDNAQDLGHDTKHDRGRERSLEQPKPQPKPK